MKKRNWGVVLLVAMALSACTTGEKSSYVPQRSGIYVKNDKSIESAIVEPVEDGKYTSEGLKKFAEHEVERYNTEKNTNNVKVVSAQVKDGNASVIFSYTDANTFLDFAKFSQDNTVKVESIQVMSLEEAKSQGQLDGIDTSQINSSANVVAIKGIADVTTQGSILAAASDGKQLNHEEKEVVTEGEMSYIVVNNK